MCCMPDELTLSLELFAGADVEDSQVTANEDDDSVECVTVDECATVTVSLQKGPVHPSVQSQVKLSAFMSLQVAPFSQGLVIHIHVS